MRLHVAAAHSCRTLMLKLDQRHGIAALKRHLAAHVNCDMSRAGMPAQQVQQALTWRKNSSSSFKLHRLCVAVSAAR